MDIYRYNNDAESANKRKDLPQNTPACSRQAEMGTEKRVYLLLRAFNHRGRPPKETVDLRLEYKGNF